MTRRPLPVGARGLVLGAILAAGLVAAWSLGLAPSGLRPNAGGWTVAREFFASAVRPAVSYEPGRLVEDAPPFLWIVAVSAWRTVVFAAAAMSLAVPLGIVLGALASDAWWRPEAFGGGRMAPLARPLLVAMRVLIALMRSVHELLWAVVLLAALGLNTAAAVVAITIPFAGTLAKVFSEMLDEAPEGPGRALDTAGSGPLATFLFGRLPGAIPDVIAYSFYRFECAVRSSAVLGFFGFQTLGYHLQLAFGDLRYREVWTILYALVALVVLLEMWSAAVRRRLVG